jgi:hypothetical protein
MTVGNGKTTPFWESRWLQGAAPNDLAPSLYEIARLKKYLSALSYVIPSR